jgi:hypothetical protein
MTVVQYLVHIPDGEMEPVLIYFAFKGIVSQKFAMLLLVPLES